MGEDVLDCAGVTPVRGRGGRGLDRSGGPIGGRKAEHAAEQAPVRPPHQGDAAQVVAQNPRHAAMARTLGVAIVVTLGLGACATYDDDFARINTRLDSLDSQVQSAAQSAESASQSAQQANQRLDSLESRVQQLEAAPGRRPRG